MTRRDAPIPFDLTCAEKEPTTCPSTERFPDDVVLQMEGQAVSSEQLHARVPT